MCFPDNEQTKNPVHVYSAKDCLPQRHKNPTASTHRRVERPKISLSDMQTLLDEKALEFDRAKDLEHSDAISKGDKNK